MSRFIFKANDIYQNASLKHKAYAQLNISGLSENDVCVNSRN